MSTILVNISGVEGESSLPGYEAQIECLELRHAVELPVVTGATRVEGTSRHGPMELVHTVDKATPILKMAALSGTNLNTVTITRMRMLGGQFVPAEVITLSNAFVVRIEVDTPVDPASNEPADEPLETISLEYSDVVWDYHQYVNDVKQGQVQGSWSTATQSTTVGG